MLPDPETGGTGQPAYPWRGRITCDPAPGQPGTPDKTRAATARSRRSSARRRSGDFDDNDGEIDYSGPEEWGYRRMVLHYAHLADAAGGVDAILIGSELRGLTTLRSATSLSVRGWVAGAGR